MRLGTSSHTAWLHASALTVASGFWGELARFADFWTLKPRTLKLLPPWQAASSDVPACSVL